MKYLLQINMKMKYLTKLYIAVKVANNRKEKNRKWKNVDILFLFILLTF